MISVIVPVYNVENYLPRCIDSILQQSYRDFELLLIDDGSKDRSGDICEEYAKKDSRIQVFHKENGGLSDARNYGLDRMKGDSVAFVDSDDYIGPDYLRVLVELQAEYQTDMAMIVAYATESTELQLVPSRDERKGIKPMDALKEIAQAGIVGVSAWGKLYRKALFETRRFPVGKLYEDLYTTPYMVEECKRCAYSTSIQYYHFQRSGSITHTISDSAIEMWNEAMEKLYSYMERLDPDTTDCVIRRYVRFGFSTVVNNLIDSEEYTSKARAFRDRHIDWWKRATRNPYLDKKDRFKSKLFLTNVNLYRLFYKLYQKVKPCIKRVVLQRRMW